MGSDLGLIDCRISKIEDEATLGRHVTSDFYEIKSRQLWYLRKNLNLLLVRQGHGHDHDIYIDILRDCQAVKNFADIHRRADIKRIIRCLEVIIELLRRRKIMGSTLIFHQLIGIVDSIPSIFQDGPRRKDTMIPDGLRQYLDEHEDTTLDEAGGRIPERKDSRWGVFLRRDAVAT